MEAARSKALWVGTWWVRRSERSQCGWEGEREDEVGEGSWAKLGWGLHSKSDGAQLKF